MSRIPDVADVWFDSGAMPWASVHYPFENKKLIEKGIAYPADYIAEAIDQTRGWFYTLLASAVLLGAKAPYKNVISLGLINDKYGQKMSKSKGNVIEPDEVINQYGVDAVRWYFYTINPPGEAKNFDEAEVALVVRRFFLLLYHSFKFYEMMQSNFAASRSEEGRKQHLLDRWILARLNETIAGVTRDFEIYEIGNAARQIEALVDDLSRWYIRRSRERPAMTATLGLVLLEISKLIAPFAPFFAEALYQAVARTGGFQVKPSVHLEDWPKKRRGWQDSKLIEKMEATRRLAAAVLAERSAAGIKVRQPLGLLKIKAEILKKEKEFWQILAEEVNVKEVIWDETITGEVWLDTRLTPVLVEEGRVRELIRLIQNLRKETALEPRHRIDLYLQIPETMRPALGRWLDFLGQEVGAREIYFKATKKFDAELAVKIEGREIWLAIKKAD
jgi:isoleucyl-tRNA synthetase